MRYALPCLVAVLSIAALADVPPRPQACQSDSQCVITTFAGCCGRCGCGPTPYAMSAEQLKRAQDRCAVVDCARPTCPPVRCAPSEPASSFRAVCRGGTCQAEKISAECRSDADCMITYPAPVCRPGPCGCCPGVVPQAVPMGKSPPPDDVTPPQQPKPNGDVKFGLSPAPTNRPDPVNCSPCMGPQPADAACRGGRCVVVPVPPRPRPPG